MRDAGPTVAHHPDALAVNAAFQIAAAAIPAGRRRGPRVAQAWRSVYSITWSARCRSDGGIVNWECYPSRLCKGACGLYRKRT